MTGSRFSTSTSCCQMLRTSICLNPPTRRSRCQGHDTRRTPSSQPNVMPMTYQERTISLSRAPLGPSLTPLTHLGTRLRSRSTFRKRDRLCIIWARLRRKPRHSIRRTGQNQSTISDAISSRPFPSHPQRQGLHIPPLTQDRVGALSILPGQHLQGRHPTSPSCRLLTRSLHRHQISRISHTYTSPRPNNTM